MRKQQSQRTELKSRDGERFHVIATITRFGTKRGWKGATLNTMMLTGVKDLVSGQPLTDHLWMTCGIWSKGMRVGDVISFAARSTDYYKGYRGKKNSNRDWQLSRPTKVVVRPRQP